MSRVPSMTGPGAFLARHRPVPAVPHDPADGRSTGTCSQTASCILDSPISTREGMIWILCFVGILAEGSVKTTSTP